MKIRALLAGLVLAACAFVGAANAASSAGGFVYGLSPPAGISPLFQNGLGSYSKGMTTGTMAAGLSAASPIYAFRYNGTGVAVVRKVNVTAMTSGTGFTAGLCHFDLLPARSFTASDTGGTAGTLTGNNGKLNTLQATTGVADIRISSTATLTAGTRTLDTDPLATAAFACSATASAPMYSGDLYTPGLAGNYPYVLQPNEGFEVQATVTGTGTWIAGVTVDWEELPNFPY